MTKQNQVKAIRGMNDLLPGDSSLWERVEQCCIGVLQRYSYQQIRTPIVESTHLFSRTIGDETDIVSKEMYSFDDRNGDSLSLRPEGTASCVRAGIENNLFYNQQQRLWYLGPMFRHERPQKGRYRQFHQLGAECYGWGTPDIEAEILSLTAQMFQALGLQETNLQINSLGDTNTRNRYRLALVEYLQNYESKLDEDSLRRLQTNPLRILDSKNAQVQDLLKDAPDILDFLSDESHNSFEQLQSHLRALGVEFEINPRLVRGLDYYNDTVFEWVNEDFGAQSTVCAGGRYDGLVERLGGADTAAFGFALGMERLVQILIEQQADITQSCDNFDVYIISVGNEARQQALVLQQELTLNDLQVRLHCGDASIKNQFKHADRSAAKVALIIGKEEAQANKVSIKLLQGSVRTIDQQLIAQNDTLNAVTNLLESL